uniref:Uncharacterized protein n=1 Tax=Rhizophagus irregularis (strain DAOM 181602 / DAOM 197198 / MUCL 43194) TaxID=747089 RepID=U9US17_RHIID
MRQFNDETIKLSQKRSLLKTNCLHRAKSYCTNVAQNFDPARSIYSRADQSIFKNFSGRGKLFSGRVIVKLYVAGVAIKIYYSCFGKIYNAIKKTKKEIKKAKRFLIYFET